MGKTLNELANELELVDERLPNAGEPLSNLPDPRPPGRSRRTRRSAAVSRRPAPRSGSSDPNPQSSTQRSDGGQLGAKPDQGNRLRTKPTIVLDTQDLADLSQRAWAAMEQANDPPTFFQHAQTLVRIERGSQTDALIRPLDRDRLRYHLARVAHWELPAMKDDQVGVPTAPPWDLVRDMLARPDPPVPALRHLTYGPFVTGTGRLHLSPGYCAEAELYYAARIALDFPPIPEHPTRDEIEQAKRVILDPLAEFPFVGDADLAHAISQSLLPFVKEQIDGAYPALAIDKPGPGAGAGLLTDILLIPALGGPPAKITEPGDEAEWRRLIFGKLRQGPPAIAIDNIHYPLRSAALASALTEAFIEDRPTRDSRVIKVPAQCVWSFAGNNLVMSFEIQRRTNTARLDPRMERPELRTGFRHLHLRRWMMAHRAEQVHARLVLIQAWLATGQPRGTVSLGSFESWSEVIGGILQVAEIPGFLANRHLVHQTADPAEVAWTALMELWWTRFETRLVGVSEVWPLLPQDLLISLDLGDGNDLSRKTRLGKRLNANRDRIYGGYRLALAGSTQGASRYRVEKL